MKVIQNYDQLNKSELREKALKIAEAGMAAIDTPSAIKRTVLVEGSKLDIKGQIFDLDKYSRIFIAGVGKVASDASTALEEVFGGRVVDGLVIDVKESKQPKLTKVIAGTHPLPSEQNVKATRELIEFLKQANEKDLVIIIVSGGGSALLCCPPAGHTSDDEAKIIDTLLKSGAPIKELNTFRKHSSLARGGHIAKYAYPATVVSLIFSDIVGDDLEYVSSGPTVKDTTTLTQAEAVMKKYDVLAKAGLDSYELVETPKQDMYFSRVYNILTVSNGLALDAMQHKARELGLTPQICDRCLTGEAKIAGENISQALQSAPSKSALLFGGETTVSVKGPGKGGRNQELALACVGKIKTDQIVLSINTDGRDNTEHAGALCDILTTERAAEMGLDPSDYLKRNDSFNFFKKVGDFLMTGDTGENVSDLMIALKK